MKKTIALLLASTVLTAAITLPALSESHSRAEREGFFATFFGDDGDRLRLLAISDHEDDDDDDDHRHSGKYDDDDDDDDSSRGGMNPAPAGTSAPPKNGLFGSGAAPQVQVN